MANLSKFGYFISQNSCVIRFLTAWERVFSYTYLIVLQRHYFLTFLVPRWALLSCGTHSCILTSPGWDRRRWWSPAPCGWCGQAQGGFESQAAGSKRGRCQLYSVRSAAYRTRIGWTTPAPAPGAPESSKVAALVLPTSAVDYNVHLENKMTEIC